MWKPIIIDGYVTNYGISDTGEVRNVDRGNILKYSYDRRGYCCVYLTLKDGKHKRFRVHRLVALAFIPNPENKREVNHIDGIKTNNSISNLEWVSSSENMLHAYRTGLHKAIKGEDHAESKYTDEQIHEVCKLIEQGLSNKKISKITGVHRSLVKDVSIGRAWKHISCKYDLSKSSKRKYRKYYPIIDRAILSGVRKRDIVEYLFSNGIVSSIEQGNALVGHRRNKMNGVLRIYVN